MKVFVTGGTGFLGSHLIPLLLERGDEVALLARRPGKDSRVRWVEGDLLSGADPGPADVIIHMAAVVQHSRSASSDLQRVNVEGTLAMVRLGAKLGARVVFVSTSGTVACFKDREGWADEESPFVDELVEAWPYYASKVRAEREARALAQQLGVKLSIVRIPVLLGPGDERGRSTSHVRRVLLGKYPFVVEGGIAYVDVRDVAAGIASLSLKTDPRPVVHFAGENESLSGFFARIARLGGVEPPKRRIPGRVAVALAGGLGWVTSRLGIKSPLPDRVVVEMGRHYWTVRSRYAAELGWQARPTDETVRDTIEYLRKSGALESGGH